MKNKTLLIMAAGLGSRFGGSKQTEKFGPNGEYIIDYSIYDAIKNGFNKVVFIIKEESYVLFRETIGKRIENKIKVEYVFQNLDNVPNKYKIPENRVKPLGTAHAILCAKSVINEPFVIINSDDYYGNDAYRVISEFLDNNTNNDLAIVGYNVINTLTENGSVKRGILKLENNNIVNIEESSISSSDGIIKASALKDGKESIIDENTNVSMNMIALVPEFMDYLEDNFIDFLENSDLEKDEYLIPDVITKSIKDNKYNVKMIKTEAIWKGVTYKEDKEEVVNYINNLISEGKYNSNLWE